ncbi:membrane protein [Oceanicola sp. 22II-s10i]|uniref:metal ABC transporter permease n=1 Tax=Oceanicola sp. 22II-s10i TaxID=1317116 RepID=UPI000B526F66|nr:metal ABC transporter permease [Oceanicola sp. 22II-s10i]OWU86206.1 membrane protein [Oceanicola sp. 22II-s10i]
MLDDFLVRAALAGVGVGLVASVLGCFVVWRRMAYFGDATAHAAILGVALSLGFALPVTAGVLAVAVIMGLAVAVLSSGRQGADAVLGVLSHSALAFGLMAVALLPNVRVDLQAYLFGDILSVSRGDLGVIWGGGALVAALLACRWQRLLTATVNGDLAAAAGISPEREKMVLTVALAVVVAVSIKVVGALLITAMLIIPAAAARPLARTPEVMAGMAAVIAVAAALGGLQLALWLDTPAGPSIVASAAAVYAATAVFGLRRA